MRTETTVYVFDHASGFDWNIDRAVDNFSEQVLTIVKRIAGEE